MALIAFADWVSKGQHRKDILILAVTILVFAVFVFAIEASKWVDAD